MRFAYVSIHSPSVPILGVSEGRTRKSPAVLVSLPKRRFSLRGGLQDTPCCLSTPRKIGPIIVRRTQRKKGKRRFGGSIFLEGCLGTVPCPGIHSARSPSMIYENSRHVNDLCSQATFCACLVLLLCSIIKGSYKGLNPRHMWIDHKTVLRK